LALNVLGLAVVLENVPWFETTTIQVGLGIGFLVIFLIACLLWPLGALIRWRYGKPLYDEMPRSAPRLAGLIGLLNLAFVVGLAASLYYCDLQNGVPPALVAVLFLPLFSAVLTLGLAVCAFRVWRKRSSTLVRRNLLYVLTLASAGFLLFLNSWNLLGFHY
jgi:hypothetical protein